MENKILELLNNKLYPDFEKFKLLKSTLELDLFFIHQKTKNTNHLSGLVKVACEFFMEAEGDASLVAVETGIPGLYIELTPEEGLEYIHKKQDLLQSNLSRCVKILEEIEGHISTITRSMPSELDIQEKFT